MAAALRAATRRDGCCSCVVDRVARRSTQRRVALCRALWVRRPVAARIAGVLAYLQRCAMLWRVDKTLRLDLVWRWRVRRRGAWRFVCARCVVCSATQTELESARLVVRTGVDGVVRDDRHRWHAGLAGTDDSQTCNHLVGCADGAQRSVDTDVLWATAIVARSGCHRCSLVLHHWIYCDDAPRAASRSPAVWAVSRMGELCQRVEHQHRNDELKLFLLHSYRHLHL